MAPRRGLANEPGFNRHVFDFGQHLGSQPDLGGLDPQSILSGNLWNQPFQDPYQAGPNTPSMMGPSPMGMPPQQDMGSSMMGSPQGPVPPDLMGNGGGAPQLADMPHPNHPHEGLRNLGNYLTSDSFKDSLMGGIIAGQMAANPQGALQMALQWRQNKDQRKFQAEQNDLNREAQKENIKARAEIEKSKSDEATMTKRVAKLQAGLQSGNVDPSLVQGWIAQHGPLDENNITQAESDFAVFQSQAKAQKEAEKARSTDIKNMASIAQTAAKTGSYIGSEYTKPGSAKFNQGLADALPEITQHRRDSEKILDQLRQARMARETALTSVAKKKLADGTPDVAGKASMQKNLKLFGILESHIKAAQDKLLESKATAAAYNGLDENDPEVGMLKTNAQATVATYQSALDDAKKELIENEAEFKQLTGKSSPADEIDFEGTVDEADVPSDVNDFLKKYPGSTVKLPKGTVAPKTVAPAATSTGPSPTMSQTEAIPGEDIAIYGKIVEKHGLKVANEEWAKRHGNAPPPSLNRPR